MDGKAVLSCMVLAVEAHGHEILTIEGLPSDDCVVQAFAEQSEPGYGTALQCGFCTPGFVMTARALLDRVPSPTMAEIKEALSGNICRCGYYAGIAQAVRHTSEAHRRGQRPMKPSYEPACRAALSANTAPALTGLKRPVEKLLYAGDLMVKCRIPEHLVCEGLAESFSPCENPGAST